DQNASSIKDKESIISDPIPEPIHSSTQPQEMIYKENVMPTISYKRKKEQGLIQEISAAQASNFSRISTVKSLLRPPKLFPFKRKLSKEMRNPVINKLTSHFTDSPKLDKNCSIDTEDEHQTDSYWVLGPHCPLCRENHMSLYARNSIQ
ncbi:5513_t:CDS:2, partial [Dentiscutata heterogama]